MSKFDILDQLVDEGNGYLRTVIALDHGISMKTLAKYVEARGME